MRLSSEIDLQKSLRQVFGNASDFAEQIEQDCARQTETARAILKRFFATTDAERSELMILADEVGLGKTYVALAVAVSLLDAIRRGESPAGLPVNRPVVLVLTPTNDALFNKWMREAQAFKKDCARRDGGLDWLQILSPLENSSRSGNIVNVSAQIREATRSKPLLLIAKQGALGSALHGRDLWRCRGLAAAFGQFRSSPETRRYWCRKGRLFDNFGIPQLEELLDLRSAGSLWDDSISPNLQRAFQRVLESNSRLADRIRGELRDDRDKMACLLDELSREALASDWPQFPLVIIDEVHGFKNEYVQSRQNFESLTSGKVCRLLGLSATPFQLRHDELLSILKLRKVLPLSRERMALLDNVASRLGESMKAARNAGELFRTRWKALRAHDQSAVNATWAAVIAAPEAERKQLANLVRPPRVAHAIVAALELEHKNSALARHLRSLVIRHHHPRGYREHFVGSRSASDKERGTPAFSWSPGIEVRGRDELAQYLMMRAVALCKDEKGLPGLGAELTGSYRHLVETSAVWRKLAEASNPLLREYRAVLDRMIGQRARGVDPDQEHRKVRATVHRALEFFKRGQKSLVFCVYTKTAETIRDELQRAVDDYLTQMRSSVFGDAGSFENFRKRFFNRREALFGLIQDHPLLGTANSNELCVPEPIALTEDHLRQISEYLVAHGEAAHNEKPDRRLIIAVTEQVAVRYWQETAPGRDWLANVLRNCTDLAERISQPRWLEAREPLSRSERAGRARRSLDPEASKHARDPLEAEEGDDSDEERASLAQSEGAVGAWVRRLREDAIGEIVAPYFRVGVIAAGRDRPPLLAKHHQDLLAEFDLDTRAVAGHVFRRILMADEFLLRYLADVEKEGAERWADYLSERYVKPLAGHLESLRDRVHAYLETLVRARKNQALLAGYHAGAENRNVIQLVKGDTQNRDRYFLGFNTPYRPEILVSTSVGQEGIDLHRECRHVIHHDLCWNPATIEQRTGRVDRIGSKVERERAGGYDGDGPTLEIAVPYLAATYDERMFEELYRRAQLFEVTLGGDMRVEGRIEGEQIAVERTRRERAGIGTEDEDLGEELSEAGTVDLPSNMIERLRVDLSVWTKS